jgi:integrase
MTIKLTKQVIDGLSAPSKGSTIMRDSEVIGFAIRIKSATKRSPQGSRSFIFIYSLHGQPSRVRIGAYPTWSVEAARLEAKDLRKRVDRGEDPAQKRRDERDAPTVDELAQRYIDDHLPTKGERAQKDDKRYIDRHVKPVLGKRRVKDVHVADATAFHRDITKNNGPVAANRALAVLSKMFSLAMLVAANETKPWRSPDVGNPCRGVKRNEEFECERYYTPEELVRISEALATYYDQDEADCVRFIMLTGCRPCEAISAEWTAFHGRFWKKRRTKQKRRHNVPLSPEALELLERRRKKATGVSVFNVTDRFQLRGVWWHIRREAKLAADARLYDVRHTFASMGAANKISLYVVGKLLGHASLRTTERYAHLFDDALEDATTLIAGTMTPQLHEQS